MTNKILRKSNKEFKEELLFKNKYYLNNEFVLLEEYKGIQSKLKVKDNYGVVEMPTESLLKGCKPTIRGAVDKTTYFKNKLKQVNKNYINFFKLVGEYKTNHGKIEVSTKYGNCITTANALLRGNRPTIETAKCKTSYFIEQAKDIHGSYYDYSEVNYVDVRTKVSIICPKHGLYFQHPDSHLKGNRCRLCFDNMTSFSKKGWLEMASRSKLFTDFKVYIIEFTSKTEKFYKIGRTYCEVSRRIKDFPNGYNIKVLRLIKGNGSYIYDLENFLISHHLKKSLKYKPSINFKGATECFIRIDSKLLKTI